MTTHLGAEVLHACARYFRLGADAIRHVTRRPDGMRAGCVTFDKSAAVFTKAAPLLAMDTARIYLTPFAEFYRKNNPKGMAGCDWDIQSATEMGDTALRIAGKVRRQPSHYDSEDELRETADERTDAK